MILNREILRPNFICRTNQFDHVPDMNRREFCERIDKWKSFLVNEGRLRKGDLVLNSFIFGDTDHYALFFACAELGIQTWCGNYPYNNPLLDCTTLAKVKFDAIFTNIMAKTFYGNSEIFDFTEKMMERNRGKIFFQEEIDIANYDKECLYSPFVHLDDILHVTHTSGYSGDDYKFSYLTHRQAMGLGYRNADALGIRDTLALHTNNIHHARALTTYFLPAIMTCDEHLFYNLPNNTDYWPEDMVKCLEKDLAREERKVVLAQSDLVLDKLQDFTCSNTKFLLHRGKQKLRNVPVTTIFGETDGPHALFINGRLVDDYYKVQIMDDGTTLVKSRDCKSWHMLDEKFEEHDGEYRIIGRRSEHSDTEYLRDILGHDDFEIVTKYGRKYLIILDDNWGTRYGIDDLPDGVFDFDFTSIHTINPNAYTSDETRQWWALKEHLYRSGFDNKSFEMFEESRIKGTDNLDKIIDNTRYL